MKRLSVAAGMVFAGIVVFAGGVSAGAIKEGKWSMTTVIRMEGMGDEAAEAAEAMNNMSPEERAMMQGMMGGMKIGGPGGGMGMTSTKTQCITNDNPVPEAEEGKDCRRTQTVKGSTVNFEVVCDDSRSTGQVTYKNDSMKGTITSTQTGRGRQGDVTIDITGKYLGPC